MFVRVTIDGGQCASQARCEMTKVFRDAQFILQICKTCIKGATAVTFNENADLAKVHKLFFEVQNPAKESKINIYDRLNYNLKPTVERNYLRLKICVPVRNWFVVFMSKVKIAAVCATIANVVSIIIWL